MVSLFQDDLETGDLTKWTTVSPGEGFAVTNPAAINGSWGLLAEDGQFDGDNLFKDYSGVVAGTLWYGWRYRFNTLVAITNNTNLEWIQNNITPDPNLGFTGKWFIRMDLVDTQPVTDFEIYWEDDNGGFGSSPITITDSGTLEVRILRGLSQGSPDGSLTVFNNGAIVFNKTDYATYWPNFDFGTFRVRWFELRMTGSMHMDDFNIRTDGPIFAVSGDYTHSTQGIPGRILVP